MLGAPKGQNAESFTGITGIFRSCSCSLDNSLSSLEGSPLIFFPRQVLNTCFLGVLHLGRVVGRWGQLFLIQTLESLTHLALHLFPYSWCLGLQPPHGFPRQMGSYLYCSSIRVIFRLIFPLHYL